MKFDLGDLLCFLALGIVVGLSAGVVIKGCSNNSKWRNEAISHGHAIYNPTNGNFQWKETKP